ncbi:MAG: histidine kinase [Gammaproteobacteria bacterium]|nr:MAG: histidine kinase [Gammaproteobacteria bacterium]
MKNVRVSEYMTAPVISARPDDGTRQAYFRIREAGIHHLPVLDGAQLVGILSDRDLRRPDWVDEAMDLSHPYCLDDNMSVCDLMTRNPVTIHTYESLLIAAELILQQGFGALPVLDKGQHLVGILCKGDLIRALHSRLLNEMAHK